MRKLICISTLMLLVVGNVYGQYNKGAGINLGQNFLFGDSPVTDTGLRPKIEAYTFYQFSPRFTIKFQAGYGEMKAVINKSTFKTAMIPIELIGSYALKDSPTFPFLHAGIGLVNIKNVGTPNNYNSKFVSHLIGGLGMNIAINPNLSFLISSDFRYIKNDMVNGIDGGFFNDGFFSFQTGLAFNFSKKKYKKKQEIMPRSDVIADAEIPEAIPQPQDSDIYQDMIKLRSRIDRLEIEIAQKTNRINQLVTNITSKDENINKLETQIAELRDTTPEVQPLKRPETQTVQALPAKINKFGTSQVKQKYDVALANFNDRNYNAVIIGLSDLLEKNSNHSLGSNFAYWIGESYFALKNYSEALKSFTKVNTFKYSSKLDYALYMEGRCYYNIGDNNKAAQIFGEFLQKYPSSGLSAKAASYLQKAQQRIIS